MNTFKQGYIKQFEVIPYCCDKECINAVRQTGKLDLKLVLQSHSCSEEDANYIDITAVDLVSRDPRDVNGDEAADTANAAEQQFHWNCDFEAYEIKKDFDRKVKEYKVACVPPGSLREYFEGLSEAEWNSASCCVFTASKLLVEIACEGDFEKRRFEFIGIRRSYGDGIRWSQIVDKKERAPVSQEVIRAALNAVRSEE